ncbi:MAG TPA: histidine kinase [Chitinophagaceae bacterium]|nr:histidine kinase [Chitinophagaceae bacterium]
MIFYRKYLIVCIIAFLYLTGSLKAQPAVSDSFGHYFLFNMLTTDKRYMVREPVYFPISDTALDQVFDKLNPAYNSTLINTRPISPVMLGVKLNPSLRHYFSTIAQSISQPYYTFLIQDSSDAILVAMGINSKNYRDFLYHVVENDSTELVPWSPIPKLEQSYGATEPYAFLGKFNAPGKQIMVEVYNKKNYSIREGVIFDWRTDLRPALNQIIVEVKGAYFNLAYPAINHGYASRFNRITGVPEDFRFPTDSVHDITFQFRKEETLLHSVHLISQTKKGRDTVRLGNIDQHGYFQLDREYCRQPGQYELVFQRQQKYPSWEESQLLRIPFEVLPASAKDVSMKYVLLLAGIVLVVLFLLMLSFQRVNKRRVRRMAQQKESAQLKLKSVRSQLNPHFMFNALGSIQNLMNKQATDEANRYLNRFAALTRAALDNSEKDMISLEDEWRIVDNYLQMEQLRFGFSYSLYSDPALHPADIEVPPMLLQPLIENAVKHGVAGKKDRHITVQAKQVGNDLQLVVEDNGEGFDIAKNNTGFGLKLSRERIELLNELYPGKPFQLNIQSTGTGTIITITVNKWI